MTQYAVTDGAGVVLRLENTSMLESGLVLAPGEVAVMVATPVDSWPAEPYPDAVLNIDGAGAFSWVDPRTLARAQADQKEIIRASREAAESAGFTWDGSTFYSDPRSETRIQGAVILAMLAAQVPEAFSIDWTLADDSTRTLDGADMIAVGKALGAHVDSVFVQERARIASIDAATTVEAVKAIVW